MGYGTVGSGVVEVINTNSDIINQRAADEINIKYVLDIRDFPGDPIQDKIVHDVDVIINDPEIRIVVEVMGGIEPAYTFVKRCLEAGKSVVTSNKALVAKHGAELLSIARDRELNFLFEASVGGGIPIIRALNSCLTADKIEVITGILNGTTNYMLSKMFYEGADYDEVLKEAQDNGYAERNPEADVEGYDACRKIAILSSLISGQQVDFEDIYTEGITKITKKDMLYAKKLGMTIKLIASSKRHDDHVHAIVAPMLFMLKQGVAERLKRHNFHGSTLTLKIKFHDFTQITRSITRPQELTTLDTILPLAKQLLKEVDYEQHPIRLIGLSVSNPHNDPDVRGTWEQLSFEFSDWDRG